MGPTDLPIAELILKQGYITRAQLDEVLAQHALDKRPLITIMLEKGFITNEHLAMVLTDLKTMVEGVQHKSVFPVARDPNVPDEVKIAAANPKNELGKYILKGTAESACTRDRTRSVVGSTDSRRAGGDRT